MGVVPGGGVVVGPGGGAGGDITTIPYPSVLNLDYTTARNTLLTAGFSQIILTPGNLSTTSGNYYKVYSQFPTPIPGGFASPSLLINLTYYQPGITLGNYSGSNISTAISGANSLGISNINSQPIYTNTISDDLKVYNQSPSQGTLINPYTTLISLNYYVYTASTSVVISSGSIPTASVPPVGINVPEVINQHVSLAQRNLIVSRLNPVTSSILPFPDEVSDVILEVNPWPGSPGPGEELTLSNYYEYLVSVASTSDVLNYFEDNYNLTSSTFRLNDIITSQNPSSGSLVYIPNINVNLTPRKIKFNMGSFVGYNKSYIDLLYYLTESISDETSGSRNVKLFDITTTDVISSNYASNNIILSHDYQNNYAIVGSPLNFNVGKYRYYVPDVVSKTYLQATSSLSSYNITSRITTQSYFVDVPERVGKVVKQTPQANTSWGFTAASVPDVILYLGVATASSSPTPLDTGSLFNMVKNLYYSNFY
jgi:beta-lactam-binding protein with PASTA domain